MGCSLNIKAHLNFFCLNSKFFVHKFFCETLEENTQYYFEKYQRKYFQNIPEDIGVINQYFLNWFLRGMHLVQKAGGV